MGTKWLRQRRKTISSVPEMVIGSVKIDQIPKCQRRQDRQSRFQRSRCICPRCLEWGNQSRSLIAASNLMASKNADSRQRPLTKGATPLGKTESMATHVDTIVELALDPSSILGVSTNLRSQRNSVMREVRSSVLGDLRMVKNGPLHLTKGTQNRYALASIMPIGVMKEILRFLGSHHYVS